MTLTDPRRGFLAVTEPRGGEFICSVLPLGKFNDIILKRLSFYSRRPS